MQYTSISHLLESLTTKLFSFLHYLLFNHPTYLDVLKMELCVNLAGSTALL